MQVAYEPLDKRYEQSGVELDGAWVDAALREAVDRIDRMLPRFTAEFPSAATEKGIYRPVEKVDWTEGFWSGILLLAYEVTGEEKYRRVAEGLLPRFRERLDRKIKVETHDLGFLYTLSNVSYYKLTGSAYARESALAAAGLLLRRYSEKAEIIQAWGNLDDPEKQGRMIIDCNLNLPLLFWAGRETGDRAYADAAGKHLKKAAEYLVRSDASTFHTYYFDVHTGEPLKGTTHQGYSDTSCWSRGQAWAVYGFALNYEYTRDAALLELSKKTANYFLNRLPADFVCYWDLIFTEKDRQYRDSSAAAIAVCGLLELIKQHPILDADCALYRKAVFALMESLRRKYLTQGGEDGFLRHSVYNYPRKMGIDEASLWGDYFYLEALVRMKQVWNRYW